MQGSKKIPITDLNEHISCKICNGYFVDATTIIECLHTFCRSCIVKYLENNKYCPVCDVQVHKTKPILNLRPDKTIQDIVFKLVPRLFHNETQRRREFYDSHLEAKPSSLELCGEVAYQYLLTPEETICLTLSYHESNNKPRYLRCPAAVSLGHLKKLIRAKYDLTENHRVDVLYNQDCLSSSLTLMDVAYIYLWKRKGPLELTYKIYECVKKPKLEPADNDELLPAVFSNNNNNWKEVQLRISENGEMSITGIQDAGLDPGLLEIVNAEPKYKNEVVTVVDSKSGNANTVKKEVPGLKYIGKGNSAAPTLTSSSDELVSKIFQEEIKPPMSIPQSPLSIPDMKVPEPRPLDLPMPAPLSSCAILSSATTTTVYSTINNSKCSTKSDDTNIRTEPTETECSSVKTVGTGTDILPSALDNNLPDKNLKRKIDVPAEVEPPAKQPKQTILNNSIGLLNLSNNHPLKKHSKMNRNGENVKDSPKVVILENEIIACATVTKVSSVSKNVSSEVTFTKPSIVNKNLINTQMNRPGTPISIPKSIMVTKPSIVSQKPPTACYMGVKPPCYMPKTTYSPVINVPRPVTTMNSLPNNIKPEPKPASTTITTAVVSKPETKIVNINCSQQQQNILNLNSKMSIKSKPNTPIGYKTLRDPPKSWNSQISKANLSKPNPDQKYSDLKNVRPKFFKMRNNIPRYLGNPASGVKPMYQVHVSPEKETQSQDLSSKMEKSEIKKHSIVKIDPKTLKPISEKAPETTSLSNHSLNLPNNHNISGHCLSSSSLCNLNLPLGNQNDLKINTSSVPIFNPLKLQSSPKSERKSPKSPHSPKTKSTSSPTGNKRDKQVSVTFTPPNPFVPRLSSPTCPMGPGQFLYPPPYDPRVMAAAYTSLWYGQRMAAQAGFPGAPGFPVVTAPPGLGLDLNQQQRKNFEMMAAAVASAQHEAQQQMSSKLNPIATPNISSTNRMPNLLPTSPKLASSSSKKLKDSRNEKSLENAVEKLTQNRNKEIGNRIETPHVPPTGEKKENNETGVSRVEIKDNECAVSKPINLPSGNNFQDSTSKRNLSAGVKSEMKPSENLSNENSKNPRNRTSILEGHEPKENGAGKGTENSCSGPAPQSHGKVTPSNSASGKSRSGEDKWEKPVSSEKCELSRKESSENLTRTVERDDNKKIPESNGDDSVKELYCTDKGKDETSGSHSVESKHVNISDSKNSKETGE